MSRIGGGGLPFAALLSLGVGTLGACSSPTDVGFPPLEIVVASGDGQYGTAGQELQTRLQVAVRTLSGKLPQDGASVLWEVTSGDASLVDIATTVTDTTGTASMRVRLGTALGEVTIRATAQHENRPSTTFHLFLVDRPVLAGVAPTSANPGQSIVLSGSNFSPTPEQNVVLFSGVRGTVSAASSTQLTVEVPPCLPQRNVLVTVQLGVVAGDTLPLAIGPGGTLESLQVGGFIDVADDEGFTCLGLPGGGPEYLAIVYSSSTVGAARHDFVLTGLSSTGPGPVPTAPALPSSVPLAPVDAQRAWDDQLREEEAALAEGLETDERAALRGPALAPPAPTPPVVGERRTFNVYTGSGDFSQVSAVARLVSAQAALFVDDDAPGGGFAQSDLQAFADGFDDFIFPTVTGAFGTPSDLDNNQRVVILFTPVVNSLTPRGSSSFVGGFFFGVDLLPGQSGSNQGEIFYALVPDPAGQFSDPRTKDGVLNSTPSVLSHEFQHMVHFNQRVILEEAPSTEAVWLSEGLAQYAEELVAREYEAVGDAITTARFRSGVRDRARRYLTGTDTVSLIISTGQGSLAERGASFLYVMYLDDQIDGDLLARLTRTTLTGVENVEAEIGRPWEDVLADWWGAVELDGPGVESGPLVYPDVDLRGYLGNPFPLDPVALGAGDFAETGTLWSSSAGYYIVTPPNGGSTTLRLGGDAGGVSPPQAGLRLRVIRTS